MERSTGEHGKGFFWSVDPQYEHTFEEQEARAAAQAQSVSSAVIPAGGKDGASKSSRKKDKAAPLDPPLKRSVKSGMGPLPPPLTSAPLISPLRPTSDCITQTPLQGRPTGGVAHLQALGGFTAIPGSITSGNVDVGAATQESKSDPARFGSVAPVGGLLSALGSVALSGSTSGVASVPPGCGPSSSSDSSPLFATLPPTVCLPIVIGPVPSSHPSSSTSEPPPIVLHNNTLVLSPVIFSSLAPEQLRALEKMGAQKALEVLQGHIVRYLKERMGKKKRKKVVPGGAAEKGGTKTGKDNIPELSSPFTTAPLPSRTAQSTPLSQVSQPISQDPSAATTVSNPSDFCIPVVECFAIEAKGGIPSSVCNSPPVPVPLPDDSRSQAPIPVDDDEDHEGRVTKKRRLGNEAGPQLEYEASAERISRAVDEDIEVDVC